MLSRLTEIKGVGDKVAERLVAYYGTEGEAIRSISALEFDQLLSVGLPPQKLLEAARGAYAAARGFEYVNLFGTSEAREVYTKVQEVLKGYAATEYGRLRLALFYPTLDEGELEGRFRQVAEGIRLVEALGGERLRELVGALGELRPMPRRVKRKRLACVLATEDRELHARLTKEYSDMVQVLLIEGPEDLEYLGGHGEVRYAQGREARYTAQLESIPQVEVVAGVREEDIIPEATLAFFEENKAPIIACARIFRLLEEAGLDIKPPMDREALRGIAARLEALGAEGGGDGGARFRTASQSFPRVLEECTAAANREVQDRLGNVSVEGRAVLEILSKAGGSGDLYRHLPKDFAKALKDVAARWEKTCAERLGLGDETLLFTGLLAGEMRYPLEASEERNKEIEEWLLREAARAGLKARRELARYLGGQRENIARTVAKALELDLLLALGRFSVAHGAKVPRFSRSRGIGFIGAKHLLLAAGGQEVQPVSYCLGESGVKLKGSNGERAVVITGANSGGKTSLLETIAQIQVMAQSGLPVLAEEAQIPLLEKVYYFGKGRGDTSAGAFEALLRAFAGLGQGGGKRLILADEIEAVTEPGAAAKIISALLEWFMDQEGVLVALVTHLGMEIEPVDGVRVDGIEATGLDEALNLVVDRNPVLNRIARSTPELILEKLSRSERGDEAFYRYIIERFKRMPAGPGQR